MTRIQAFYPALVGLLLGLLQTGLFFQLSFTLSSSFGTFLLVTLSWLMGSAVGVLLLGRLPLPTPAFLGLAVLAYVAVGILLAAMPFVTGMWPLYGLLVLVTGFYPGVFFARSAPFYTARTLFARENNGFIAGLVLGTLLFMLSGRVVLYVLPLLVAGIVALMSRQITPSPSAISTVQGET